MVCDENQSVKRLISEDDEAKYAGQYVCTVSFSDQTVVSAHLDVTVARRKACEKGHLDPVCFYVPFPGEHLFFRRGD